MNSHKIIIVLINKDSTTAKELNPLGAEPKTKIGKNNIDENLTEWLQWKIAESKLKTFEIDSESESETLKAKPHSIGKAKILKNGKIKII